MKKQVSFILLFALFIFSLTSFAQVTVQIGTGTDFPANTLYGPVYRYSNSSTTSAAKCNILYTQAEMAAAGIPAGSVISKVEFHKVDTATFLIPASLDMYMANTGNSVLATSDTWAGVLSTHTQVYSSTSFNVPNTAGWVEWNISPFIYSGGALEIATNLSMTGGSTGADGNFQWEFTTGLQDQIVGVTGTGTTFTGTVSGYKQRPNIRITYTATACSGTPVAGTALSSDATICNGKDFTLYLDNNTQAGGIEFEWEVATNQNGPWTSLSAPSLPIITTSQQTTSYYRCIVSCTNSMATDTSSVVSVINIPGLPGGIYTIGPTGDYLNFTDAAAALECGITGSVVFDVIPNSGPYNEQVTIDEIYNASPANTVLFNGNGNTVTFAPTSSDRHIFLLNGASYVTFSNLNLIGTDPANGVGFLMTNNADHNNISGCNIDLSATFSSTGTTSAGIQVSGSLTNPIGAGVSGSFNTFINNSIKGARYGITIAGASVSNNSVGNLVLYCTIEDFYTNGIYLLHVSDSEVSNNEISRPTRTTLSTFTGIYHATSGQNNVISSNKIHSPFDGNVTSTSAAYGIHHSSVDAGNGFENIVVNNIIYNMNGNGTQYGLYNSGSDNIHYLHNTVSLDNASSTSGTTRGFYQTTGATGIELKNNIISVSRGGSGIKYCLYFGTATSTIASDYNILFLNAPAGTNHLGYYSSSVTSFQDWQLANSGAYDQNSDTLDPQFINAGLGQLYPMNHLANNLGTALGIATDITGAPRNMLTPDMGAFEFEPIGKDVEILNLSSALAPCYAQGDTLLAWIKNIGTLSLDFSVDNLPINWSISGASSAFGNVVVTNGTIAPGDSMMVAITTAMDVSAIGTHEILATVNASWDEVALNNEALLEITVDPVFLTASKDSICSGDDVTLSLNGFTGNLVEWEINTGSGFAAITGAMGTVTEQPVLEDASYRAVYCGNRISDTVYVFEILINVPVTVADTICEGGNATVSASSNGNISWYDAASGGNKLGTGNSLALQNLTATTTVYAEAKSVNGTVENVGETNPGTSNFITSATGWGLYFTAHDNTTIETVTVYPVGTGNITILIKDLNGALVASSAQLPLSGTGTNAVVLPVDLNVTPGDYTMEMSYSGITNMRRLSSGVTFPYTAPSGAISITKGANATASGASTTYYWFFDWTISTGCTSASRTAAEIIVNPLPAIVLPTSVEICQGDVTVLDPGAGQYDYLWSTNEVTQTINASASGEYWVQATSLQGCSKTDTAQLIVNNLPVVVANATALQLCEGDSVNLTGSGAVSYVWNNNVINGVAFAPLATETYTVTGTDANNCENTAVVTITVNPLPTVIASASVPEVCLGDEVTLTGTGALVINWDNGVVDNVPFAPASTFVYTVTGTDANNCSNTDEVTVTVNLLPVVTANVTASEVCLGDEVTFTGSGALTYSWNNGITDGIPVAPAVTMSYEVTGTDANNCSSTDEITVVVNPLPEVMANASSTEVCDGEEVVLAGSGAITYTWDNNVTDNTAFVPASTLVYTVTGTDANNCSNTDEVEVVVNELPQVSLDTFDTLCVNHAPITLDAGQPGPGTYTIGQIALTIFDPAAFGPGSYEITYLHTDDNGCSASATGEIVVDLCTGIETSKPAFGQLNIYPNPANKQFTIEIPSGSKDNAEIILYNANGKIVMHEKVPVEAGHNKVSFESLNFSRGLYFIRIQTTGSSFDGKILLN